MIPVFVSMELDNENFMRGLISGRRWNTFARHAFQTVGEYWRNEILPEHFKYSAFKYGYQARTPLYQKKKKNKAPLVLTGEMMKQIMAEKNVKATDHNVRIIMRGPNYMKHGSTKPYDVRDRAGNVIRHVTPKTGPDKVKEITSLLQSEVKEMEKMWANDFIDQFNNLHPKGITVGRKV